MVSVSVGSHRTRSRIPKLPGFDHSLAYIRDPYEFIARHCQTLGSDVFEMRLLLRRTLCMTGPEAARVFYDLRLFKRAGASPMRLQRSLLGVGGVQTLDGAEHTHRKRMFLSLMSETELQRLASIVARNLRARAQQWTAMKQVVLYHELHRVLTCSVCEWAAVPLARNEIDRRARQLTAMFDRAGAVGPAHWLSRRARTRAERWLCLIIERIRSGEFDPPSVSAVSWLALYEDIDGKRLDSRAAAVELINVLRPTVAISVYIVFMAHALHEHPECAPRIQSDARYADAFIQEVRRFYPFFPAIPAIVRESFEWREYEFKSGTRVLLDLHGVNTDPRSWENPKMFRPERFLQRPPDAFDFVPQGGGDYVRNHRCAGEWLTIEVMHTALNFLLTQLEYSVPKQDLSIDRRRLPALPRSRFVISDVRLRDAGKAL